MTITIEQASLTYFALPKVACTSFKYFFYEAMTGESYVDPAPGWHIHHVYPTPLYRQMSSRHLSSKYRLLVVRDPIERLVSAYRNRVHKHRELSHDRAGEALARLGLDANPSLEQFVDLLPRYQSASESIRHHTRPMVDFVGSDLSSFTIACDISECERLVWFTNGLLGSKVALGRYQMEGSQASVGDLGPAQRERLLDYYRQDYKVFGSVIKSAP